MKNKLPERFTTKIWILMCLFYGLDCLIITPYAILFKNCEEVGLGLSFLYNNFGILIFPVWFVIFSVLLYFGLKYFDKFLEKRIGKLKKYPLISLLITWIILMSLTIIHNINVIGLIG